MTDDPVTGLPAKKAHQPVINRDNPHQRVELTEAGYELLAALGEEGITVKSTAAVLGIAPVTFRDLLRRDQRAADAFAEGRAHLERGLVLELVRRAKDPAQGPVPLLFALKALAGVNEQGPAEAKASGVTVNITLPGPARTDDEFVTIIDAEAKTDGDQ
jgi:predicted DNA-binding protein (UPF0251 family)